MSFGSLLVVRPCYTHVQPWLETGCRRYMYCRPSLCRSIHKVRSSPISASGKPSSNGEGEETNEDATASEVSPVEAQTSSSDSEMGARNSLWQSLKGRLPIVGSWFGGQNVASPEDGYAEIKWGGVLDPTPDNLLALLLTGLLGLAAIQIFWQLFLVAITITLAALKYSVIAAILLALLIVFL